MPTAKQKAAPKPPGGPPTVKRGFLSKDNKSFIERNAGKMTAEHIALLLRRPVAQVLKHIDEVGAAAVAMKVSQNLSAELEDRPEWAELRKQYDEEELKFFKYRYVQFMNQFGKDDILPTEELQIFSLIKLEIMANQAMRERRVLLTQQKMVTASLEGNYESASGFASGSGQARRLKEEARELESEFARISVVLKDINTRQQSYEMQSKSVLADLKGTREQRVKVAAESKTSFLGFLKALAQEDFRNQQGREMEMMRVAMEKEQGRISSLHEYVDGTCDQPLLTPETVLSEEAPDA